MKVQHETLIALEEKCRKMALIIKDKKRKRQEVKEKQASQQMNQKKVYTH